MCGNVYHWPAVAADAAAAVAAVAEPGSAAESAVP